MKNGGLITKTINTSTTSSASGVWSLQEQYEAETNDAWPKAVDPNAITDPYFSDVKLLVKFDGTNNSTTYTDSSSNNIAITSDGNANISNAVTKFGNTSGYFSYGITGRIKFTETQFVDANVDFTMETWFNPTNGSVDGALCGSASSGNHQMFRFNGGGTAGKVLIYNNGHMFNYTGTTYFTSNTWYHVAVTRENNVCRFFIDGVLQATNSNFNNYIRLDSIGTGYNRNNSFVGYMDEFRLTNNVARYTANFTPPTEGFPTS